MTLKSGFAQSGLARIFYEETGTGRPVVFAHAGVTDRRMWDPQFDQPLPGYRYVRSDMRGFGNSEWIAEPFSPHSDLLAVIEKLDLDDAVLVGCSMGGRSVMEVAVSAPDRISGLVVIGTSKPGWEPNADSYVPPQWALMDPLYQAGQWERIAELDAQVWVTGVGRTRDNVDQDVFLKVIEMDTKPVMTESERDEYFSWMEPSIAEQLDQISVPVLVVVGQYDLPQAMEGTGRLADRISDRPRQIIPNAAHLPSMEQPAAFNALFHDWLETLT